MGQPACAAKGCCCLWLLPVALVTGCIGQNENSSLLQLPLLPAPWKDEQKQELRQPMHHGLPRPAQHPHPGTAAVCRGEKCVHGVHTHPHCSKPRILIQATGLQMNLRLRGTGICPSSSSLSAGWRFTRSVARICDTNDS